MRDDELQIIEKLTGVAQERIKLADDGFWSRGYVIDDGRIVFKFKKVPEVSYVSEIRTLEFVGSLSLGVSLQRVGWVSPDDRYLGVYGVVGRPLETVSQLDYQSVGAQLAFALRKLHQAHPEGAEILTLDEELSAWQGRYMRSHDRLLDYFSEKELVRLDRIMFEVVPAKLKRLGEISYILTVTLAMATLLSMIMARSGLLILVRCAILMRRVILWMLAVTNCEE